jgi:hypothetical protein
LLSEGNYPIVCIWKTREYHQGIIFPLSYNHKQTGLNSSLGPFI